MYFLQILYFLEYSPGLKFNPVSNRTRVNLLIQINEAYCNTRFQPSLDFNPGDFGPRN